MVDEEQFRLITGFNDIFVVIAIVLGYVALTSLGSRFGGLMVAAVSWGLAEFFTRQRRMALPSIVLLLGFAIGLFTGTLALAGDSGADGVLPYAVAGAVATGGTLAHWLRFRVPITIAVITSVALVTVVSLILAPFENATWIGEALRWIAFAAGLGVFAFAMRWDLSDPERRTRRSDVAFWLHLLAAPLIAHPIFTALGLVGGGFLRDRGPERRTRAWPARWPRWRSISPSGWWRSSSIDARCW